MLPIPQWTVDNSYLLEFMVNPTRESNVLMNQQMFYDLFILQNGLNSHDLVAVYQTDSVGIKFREKSPVTFEAYSSKETPPYVLKIPESDFFKFISPKGESRKVTALIPKRRLSH